MIYYVLSYCCTVEDFGFVSCSFICFQPHLIQGQFFCRPAGELLCFILKGIYMFILKFTSSASICNPYSFTGTFVMLKGNQNLNTDSDRDKFNLAIISKVRL
jgi:hypothetical protein